ncbi:MAG TPA: hypothetical protein QF509_08220 [Rhodospirillales bacterium]|jgi:hypothetical protein|nr:hypothetical protein [Rhodospirillales bacterium]
MRGIGENGQLGILPGDAVDKLNAQVSRPLGGIAETFGNDLGSRDPVFLEAYVVGFDHLVPESLGGTSARDWSKPG